MVDISLVIISPEKILTPLDSMCICTGLALQITYSWATSKIYRNIKVS